MSPTKIALFLLDLIKQWEKVSKESTLFASDLDFEFKNIIDQMLLLKAECMEMFNEKPRKWFNASEFSQWMSPIEYYEQIYDIFGMFEKEYQHKKIVFEQYNGQQDANDLRRLYIHWKHEPYIDKNKIDAFKELLRLSGFMNDSLS